MRKYASSAVLFIYLFLSSCASVQLEDLPSRTFLPAGADAYAVIVVPQEYPASTVIIKNLMPDIDEGSLQSLMERLGRVYLVLYKDSFFIRAEARIPLPALSHILRKAEWERRGRRLWYDPKQLLYIHAQDSIALYHEKVPVEMEEASDNTLRFLRNHNAALLLQDSSSFFPELIAEHLQNLRIYLSKDHSLQLEVELQSTQAARAGLVLYRLVSRAEDSIFQISKLDRNIRRNENRIYAESPVLSKEEFAVMVKKGVDIVISEMENKKK